MVTIKIVAYSTETGVTRIRRIDFVRFQNEMFEQRFTYID